ncbi:hypothetical protein CRUP_002343 [Coryphaenoides rupestris]|nr:hypothetical protein CRUP_002343 [Coryphaenoides rupestris]
MAGVNLNEESARILATNSELVGTHIRSCKDEAFLHPGLLHRRILETAKRFGVTEVPMDSASGSRSRQEDPEQARLKQKAKELTDLSGMSEPTPRFKNPLRLDLSLPISPAYANEAV